MIHRFTRQVTGALSRALGQGPAAPRPITTARPDDTRSFSHIRQPGLGAAPGTPAPGRVPVPAEAWAPVARGTPLAPATAVSAQSGEHGMPPPDAAPIARRDRAEPHPRGS